MINIQPFNNICLAEMIEEKEESSIHLPDRQVGRFIKVKILAIGGDVNPGIKVGSICYANPLLEVINPKQPKVGFINSKDILARIAK